MSALAWLAMPRQETQADNSVTLRTPLLRTSDRMPLSATKLRENSQAA
jgi:hypothetical protein